MTTSDDSRNRGGVPQPVTADEVRSVVFATTSYREGYDRAEVDAVMQRAADALRARESGRPADPVLTVDELLATRFAVTKYRQGYDQDQVDDLLDRVIAALRPELARRVPAVGAAGHAPGPVRRPARMSRRMWLAVGACFVLVLS